MSAVALVFPPPLDQPVNQFVNQCASFCSGATVSEKFVSLLRSSNQQVAGNARGLLTNLAQFPENKDAIRELGLFGDLVELFKSSSSNPQLQLGLIAGLATLVSDCPPNQVALQNTEFTKLLSPAFSSLQGDAKEQSLRIVMHLSRNQETNEELAKNTTLIQNIYKTLPPASSKEYTLSVEYALSVGLGLAENPVNGKHLISASIGGQMIDYMTSSVLALRLYSLKTIRLLSEHSSSWRVAFAAGGSAGVISDGFLPALLPQIKSKNDSILQLSLFILRNIAKGATMLEDETATSIGTKLTSYASHIVPVLLEMIQPTSGCSEQITKIAYMTLSEILSIEAMQSNFVQHKGVGSLIALIYGGTNEVASASSSLLSSLLANNDLILQQFIEQQELERLLKHIGTLNDDELKSSLLGVVANILLASDDLREQFFDSNDCLQLLASYLTYSHEGCKRNALRAMVNLTLMYQKIPRLLQEDIQVLQHVQRILDSQPSLGPLAMSLLVNLTSNEDVHARIIKQTKSLQWVVDYLKHADDTRKLSGLKLITNFSVKGRNRKWFHEHKENVVALIQSLQSSPNSEIATQASAASVNLSFPYESHYEDEEVEQAKALPEIVEIDETSSASASGPSSNVDIELETERLSKELKDAEEEKKRIQEEQEKMEKERILVEQEALAKIAKQEKEEAERLSKQKEDEARLKALQEEEERNRKEEEAKQAAALEEKRKEEEELLKQEAEAEAIRKQITQQREADEKRKQIELQRQQALQQIEEFKTKHQELTKRSEKAITTAQSDLSSLQQQIEEATKKLSLMVNKREKRERKLSRSLLRSERTQKKLNSTLKQSSPKKGAVTSNDLEQVSTKQKETEQKAEEAQKALRRAERKYQLLVKERDSLELKRKADEESLENLLISTEKEQKERAENLLQMQAEIGEEPSHSALDDIEQQLKEREQQLIRLQAQRDERRALASKQEEELKIRREKFIKEKELLQQKISQQQQQEMNIRKELAAEETSQRKRIEEEQNKAKLALAEKEKRNEQTRARAIEQLEKQKRDAVEVNNNASDPKKKMSVRRTNIAREIYDTEKSYVTSLRTLVWKFQKPLQQQITSGKKGAITNDDIKTLFSNVEMILNFNKILLEGIEQRLRNWSDEQHLGDIFIKLTDFLRIYVGYVNNFDAAIELSTQLKKKNPDFAAFLRKAEKIPACRGLTFESFLIMPVQRVPRYVMLLMDLLKNTWDDHSDYHSIEVALQKMKETGDFINESKRDFEASEKIKTLAKTVTGKVPKEFIVPHRKFIKEGAAKWVGNFTVQLFLFTDILLVTKPGRGSSYDSKIMMGMTQLSINKCEDSKKITNSFKLCYVDDNKKKQEFTFSCDTELERDGWIKAIYQQADTIASGTHSFRQNQNHS